MYTRIIYLALLACLLYIKPVHSQAQNHLLSTTERIETQINSVARTWHIALASVCVQEIDNYHDKTSTNVNCLISKKEFTVSDGFLKINNTYFNLEKLLYFKVEEDKRTKQHFLEFYFQFY